MVDIRPSITMVENAEIPIRRRKSTAQCPSCKTDTSTMQFRNEISKREHRISGLCQNCQDKTFGPDE